MRHKANTKAELFDAQQIGWMTDYARVHAAQVARAIATDKAALAYQHTYVEAYDSAFKAEFEQAVYQTTMGRRKKDRELPF